MRRVIGIGETILDILFKNHQAVSSVPGGSTFNSMISLGRAGVSSCLLSEIGDDKVGGMVRSFLRENRVDDSYLTEYPDHKSPISLAFLDEHNNATYSFYKEPFKQTDWECPTIGSDDIILFGSYYALNPDMRYKVTALLDEARRVGAIVYYDVNFRRNHAGEATKLMGTLIENLEYADIVQVGAKAMYDHGLLTAAGQCGKPVILKRGFSSTLQELVHAADFVMSCGNDNVILCERGIRSFETQTRFTLDLCGVAWLKEYCNLPIILDPSHAMGYAYGVADLARACTAMGIDGLLVETHPSPLEAKSDAAQQLGHVQFEEMYKSLEPIVKAVGRTII